MKRFVFIVKPVSTDCNLGCSYCYHNWLAEKQKKHEIMSNEILQKLFSNLARMQQEEVEIIWHGGEPLLAGKAFFRSALAEEKKIRKKITNLIQTNGILLDEEWSQILKEGKFKVGISIDGPEEIHDFCRVSKAGAPTFKIVEKKIKMIKDQGLSVGPVSVITKKSVSQGKEVFSFLYGMGLRRMNFSPCPDSGESYAITGKEYGDFLLAVFREWMRLDDPDIKIVPLSSFMQVLVGGSPTICSYQADCSNFLSVDADGSVYVCGRSVGVQGRKIGNIKEQDFDRILKEERYLSIRCDMANLSAGCRACEWLAVCNGGCPLHRDEGGKYLLCDAIKKVLPEMKRVVNKYL